MNNCASCHNVACSAIGQRTPERWDSLKEAHKEQVSGADVDAIFAYLKANFDSSKPEPKVPPQFLEGGCTPHAIWSNPLRLSGERKRGAGRSRAALDAANSRRRGTSQRAIGTLQVSDSVCGR